MIYYPLYKGGAVLRPTLDLAALGLFLLWLRGAWMPGVAAFSLEVLTFTLLTALIWTGFY